MVVTTLEYDRFNYYKTSILLIVVVPTLEYDRFKYYKLLFYQLW
ncbi:hypothetical protein LEP1GSC008_4569 [Leptospira kirschneri serovar Bulgarica str. Nikolaevo]|uniref:Uncharacterized protein n=1 Tax=Leptospira kirschneri serovar Bulgarica str. Nikolaevo TaxID=1240687 RepID=M6FTB6_9LEPT|nr:hypothetical protein LEP1GSC008_4569 [Leptospira kirschneri serovar Bulgarica str. Nikolaevo]